MLKRFFRYLRALFGSLLGRVEDPEILLEQAKQDMQDNLNKNKQRVIAAITERNRLQMELDKTNKQIGEYNARAEQAIRAGERDLARQMLVEKQLLSTSLETLQQSLDSANSMVQQAKEAIATEERQIRQRTAEILAQKTRWKSAQIQKQLSETLGSLQISDASQDVSRATEMIDKAQAQAAATAELGNDSVVSKLNKLDDISARQSAELELQQLEQKVNPGSQSVQTSAANGTSGGATGVDSELEALENRIRKIDESSNQK